MGQHPSGATARTRLASSLAVLAALALVLVSVAMVPAGRTREAGGAIIGAVARAPQRGLEPFVLTAKSGADQLTLHARAIERGPLRHLAAVVALTAAAVGIAFARRRSAPRPSDSTVTHAVQRRRGPPALAS